jgi:TonB family protein
MELTTQGTANDERPFKRGFGDWFWYSIAAAAVFHLVMFAFWPEMTSADVSVRSDELTAIELPPEIEIPPPPEQIARPATPVVSSAQIDDDITIAPTTFDANPIENLPPPPTASAGADDISRGADVHADDGAAGAAEPADVQRALVRNYPPLLRDAGIGGTPMVWFFIDENGRVLKTQLSQSSGYDALDAAAIAVANHAVLARR